MPQIGHGTIAAPSSTLGPACEAGAACVACVACDGAGGGADASGAQLCRHLSRWSLSSSLWNDLPQLGQKASREPGSYEPPSGCVAGVVLAAVGCYVATTAGTGGAGLAAHGCFAAAAAAGAAYQLVSKPATRRHAPVAVAAWAYS